MLYLKACNRCGGDLAVDEDTYGQFIECIQCGWIADLGIRAGEMSWKGDQAKPLSLLSSR